MAEHHNKHDEHNDHEEHIGIPGYLVIFGILVVCTILTYFVALTDLDNRLFPGANTLVALLIAFFKMSCVVLYFMHVRWQSKLIWLSGSPDFSGWRLCLPTRCRII